MLSCNAGGIFPQRHIPSALPIASIGDDARPARSENRGQQNFPQIEQFPPIFHQIPPKGRVATRQIASR
jgi:hypothetical protein